MKKLLQSVLFVFALTLSTFGDTVILNWDATATATSYNVYSRVTGGGTFVVVANVTTPTFSTNHVSIGRWDYNVKSVNLAGESTTASNTVTTPAAPPAPSNLTMTVTNP